ncbi:MAG: 1,4-alpha-glucan branching protein GlgB [bacterium]
MDDKSLFTEYDIYLFKQGNHFRIYEKFGAHLKTFDDREGTYFAVWAPNAQNVSVIGEFNKWEPLAHPLKIREDKAGIWEGFIPGVKTRALYKYHIISQCNDYTVDKGDPFSYYWELSPQTASRIWDLDYIWKDREWMEKRSRFNSLGSPMSIYEMHIGSWKRIMDENNRSLSYRELAPLLADYIKEMGFTHVEFLPIMEHPFYGSWGYQIVGYFAPTSRYGTPQDFMYLIDYLHQNNIGVILDWVPSHFPGDEHGLVYFDGTHLYEHADPRKGFQPDWKSYIFNYGRCEVKNFLISNAFYWLDKYHIDALRVDAVASMLYLDYSRKEGEWIPNEYGGKENIEAINFLRQFNEAVYANFPDVQTIAEESTAWPMVSKPIYVGGLGFGMKWNMGWMHDTLDYFSKAPLYRKYHHNQLTFSIWYAFAENFVLSLSHDEIVYGKGSLLSKMPGDQWQKFANLRLLLAYMYTHPGKKLIFMGSEFGQWNEWNHETGLEWDILHYSPHEGIQHWMKDLNHLYRSEPCLYELDFNQQGFQWINADDSERSVISFMRKAATTEDILLTVCNLTPIPHHNYRIGVPISGCWREILNSDSREYGGSGYGNTGNVEASPIPSCGFYNSLSLILPPLGAIIFKREGKTDYAE